jgi:hypothetical protein
MNSFKNKNMLYAKKALSLTLIATFFTFPLTPAQAATASYDFSTPGDYTISNGTELEVSGGLGQLRGTTNLAWTNADITGDTGDIFASPLAFDADGDSDLDLYVGNNYNQQNRLWINDGTGSFTSADISGDTGDTFASPLAFDADGDGDLDLYVGNHSQQNRLWLNDGSGSFTGADITGDTGPYASPLAFDADGDGDLDLYVANFSNQQNRLWINDGTGSFTSADITGDTGDTYASPLAFDADGDGDLDLYVANSNQQNRLWINDGTGSFTSADISGDTENTYASPLAFDADGDGDLDLYVANYNQQNRLWINDDTGSFTSADITGDTGNTWASITFDADGDGDLDLYVGNNYNQQNRLWINDGTGSFTSADITGDIGNTWASPLAFDADGDGDLDLYVANLGEQNRLWLNQGSTTYPSTSPYLEPITAQTFTATIDSFTHTLGSGNQGTVTYQVSTDNGTTWSYWDGAAWTTTTATDGTQTSSPTDINTNIATLDTDGGDFLWRAYLNSDGTQAVELDQVDISYDTNQAPTDISIDGINTDTIDENTVTGSTIGTLTTTDPDTADTHTYSFCGGADDTHFSLSGSLLQNATVFDYESPVDTGGTAGDNTYEVCIRTTDSGAGSLTYDETITITVTDVDDTPPPTPTSAPDLQSSSDTGPSDTDNLTNDTTPSIDIPCSESGSTITLYSDNPTAGTVLGTAVCSGPSVTITPTTPLGSGTYSLTATATDTSGNESGSSPALSITIDTTPPTTPSILSVDDDDTGPYYLTESTTPTIVFSGEDGATLSLSGWTCSPNPITGGQTACTPNTPLPGGTNTISAPLLSDPSGNTASSAAFDIQIQLPLTSSGGPEQKNIIHVCSNSSDQCVEQFPVRDPLASTDQPYEHYLTCIGDGTTDRFQCARTWALAKGFSLCDTNSNSCLSPTSQNPSPDNNNNTSENTLSNNNTPNNNEETPSTSESDACPFVQYSRYPENRGLGLPWLETLYQKTLFADADADHPAYSALLDLAEQKIIHGDSDSALARLDDPINRAEFVKIMTIARSDKLSLGKCLQNSNFSDVDTSAWFHNFIKNMEQHNIVHGYPDGQYRPSRDINLAETYKIIAIGLDFISKQQAQNIIQNNQNLKWFEPYQQSLQSKNIIPNDILSLDPSTKLSRGQTFQILSSALNFTDLQK